MNCPLKNDEQLLQATKWKANESEMSWPLSPSWGQIADAMVDVQAHTWAWRLWIIHCEDNSFPDPFLPSQMDMVRLNLLVWLSLPGAVQEYTGDAETRSKQAPLHIYQTFGLGGYSNPGNQAAGSGTYLHLALLRL
jgi:hypothetical protein